MGKIIKENLIRKTIAEAINGYLITESFASSLLKKEVMKNGGVKKVYDSYHYEKEYGNSLVGLIDSITDEDIMQCVFHDEEDEAVKIYILCNNGSTVTVPVSRERYEQAEDAAYNRYENDADDSDWADTPYRSVSPEQGAAFANAMDDFKLFGDNEGFQKYKQIRNNK